MPYEDRFALSPRRHDPDTDWFGLEANPSGNITPGIEKDQDHDQPA